MITSRAAEFAALMRAEQLPELAISTFLHYYQKLVSGEQGLIPEEDIRPVTELPDATALPQGLAAEGRELLSSTVVIKLNGGLGTSMGLHKAKSLLLIRDGHTFLDIVARQAQRSAMPIVLMNSFHTRADSLAALRDYPNLSRDLPPDFVQHKVPKIRQSDLSPVRWPDDPELEWSPPGHGDLYTALVTSGMLEAMLAAGYRYAFISNVDNLGAVVDERLLGYFATQGFPFMMECAERSPADRKGGHLAMRCIDGHLILRESAQCAQDDLAAFQDIGRHRYFNTNNLWLDLQSLVQLMAANDGILSLAMIRNRKTVDPRDPNSIPVYQLETAMGSAIAAFPRAGAIRVPRDRFAPIKTNSDLLAVRSDAYILNDDFRIVVNPNRALPPPIIDLDPKFFGMIDQFEARFPHGPPSLLKCESLTVKGDVHFGQDVTLAGRVTISGSSAAPKIIADHMTVQGMDPSQDEVI